MTDMLRALQSVLDFRLFEMGGGVVTVGTLLTAGILLVVTVVASSSLSSFVSRTLLKRGGKPGPVAIFAHQSTQYRYPVF